MRRRWALPTRYTLGRNTANIIKDFIFVHMQSLVFRILLALGAKSVAWVGGGNSFPIGMQNMENTIDGQVNAKR